MTELFHIDKEQLCLYDQSYCDEYMLMECTGLSNISIKLTALLCISLLFFSSCGRETDDRPQKQSGQADNSGNEFSEEEGLVISAGCAVLIDTGKYCGKGMVYEKDNESAVIVTAAHVLVQAESAEVTFSDGTVADTDRIYVNDGSDCGFIRVVFSEAGIDNADYICSVLKDRSVFDDVQSGQGVFIADPGAENVLGCRYATVIDSWIYVEDFQEYMMLLSGEADTGMSGSGVLDENGIFLGILCGGNEDNELAVLPYSIIDARYVEIS